MTRFFQPGIFALGTSSHSYLEFRVKGGENPTEVISSVASLLAGYTTAAGVNLVAGFRPELWSAAKGANAMPQLSGFIEPIIGANGYRMPATQSDIWLWHAGASYDVVFDAAIAAARSIAGVAAVERETVGWSYRHNRDLTGFEDGTENPHVLDASSVALVPAGKPGEGGSVLLFQIWRHRSAAWNKVPREEQELIIGRTKDDSVELVGATQMNSAHVPRSKVVVDGDELGIFRHNTSYGNVSEHGTVFVGFSADQYRLDRMLRRMAGAEDGVRDRLTDFAEALTGAYYFVPSVEALRLS